MRCEPHAIGELFRARGFRRTKQREAIYAGWAASRVHPTADELLVVVRAGEPCLSLATVYNTLEAFVAAGWRGPCPRRMGSRLPLHADIFPHAHVELPDGG